MQYNIMTFGALGNGIHNDTQAIQAAIDTCRQNGGGRVLFPGGRVYRAGLLKLCSNIELHFEMGAVLMGSSQLSDYQLSGQKTAVKKLHTPSYRNCEYDGTPSHYFLYAKDCHNVAITGRGIIDGNEDIFYGKVTHWRIEGSFYPRVPMLYAENVERLTIEDITFRRSAFWTVHLVGCRDVGIRGIRILNNLRMANCDGIDPDHCQNVRIEGCHIQCANDCIVFKNTLSAMQYGPCENMTVSGCTLISTSSAIKFGSESEDVMRNMVIENCVISRSNRGIALQLRDKGSIENIVFHNLVISTRLFHKDMYWGQAEPISVTVLPRKENTQVGIIRNIRFSNILCEGENGIFLYSQTPGHLQHIFFDGITLHLHRQTAHGLGAHDLRPTCGPTSTNAGLAHVHACNANHVFFHNCQWTAEIPATPCIAENCQNFHMEKTE